MYQRAIDKYMKISFDDACKHCHIYYTKLLLFDLRINLSNFGIFFFNYIQNNLTLE